VIDSLVIETARIEAALAVKRHDGEYRLRQIFRWYSRTFHTPLHQVQDLDLLDILQAFYEDRLGDMKDDELHDEIQDLIRTPEEEMRALREDAKTRSEDELAAQAIEASLKAADLAAKSKEKQTISPVGPREPVVKPLPEATLEGMSPTGKAMREDLVAPPDVHITFIDEDMLELEASGHGLMTQPIKR
jgi:hypothetical protein